MARTLVISPHLDDAVLSVGQYLADCADATVVTVFAGPPPDDRPGGQDHRNGFTGAAEAVARRRDEDATALALLGCAPHHLDFPDRQYRVPTSDEEVEAALRKLAADLAPETVLGPLGLVHPDHRQVARVWPRALARLDGVTAYAYEELPYRVQFPADAAAVAERFRTDYDARERPAPGGRLGTKAQAMLAYASQLGTVSPLVCLCPERFWLLKAVP